MIPEVEQANAGPSTGELGTRFLRVVIENDVLDLAAQVAFYLLFAVFPFLLFATTVASYFPLGAAMGQTLSRLSVLIPSNVAELINEHLQSFLTEEDRPRLLTIGLLTAIWSASRGVDSVRAALNFAYGVRESRAWWKRQILAIVVTVLGAVLVIASIALLVAGGALGYRISERLGYSTIYMWILSAVRWPVTAVVIAGLATTVYRVLPNVKHRLRHRFPGAVVATLVWLLVTWGFGSFVDRWDTYGPTYGSLTGVIVLMFWFYLSVFIFLCGGQLNAFVERVSSEARTRAVTGRMIPHA
jgi:membrane protein